VFAGYGMSDTSLKYNDYDGVEVRGKAVMVLRNAPPSDSEKDFENVINLALQGTEGT